MQKLKVDDEVMVLSGKDKGENRKSYKVEFQNQQSYGFED